MSRTGLPCLALLLFMAGCIPAPRPKPTLTDPDPSLKIPAIKLSVQNKDNSAAAQLVKDLNSDDPAVRFYAIEGLRKLTGEDFGYRYYDDTDAREPAVERWKAWLVGWEAGSAQK
jgi:hypothetical protein